MIDADDEHSLTEVKVIAVDGDEKEYETKTDEDGWFDLFLHKNKSEISII